MPAAVTPSTASTSIPTYLDDFDAWRNKYKNPFKDLRDTSDRVRNWDSERRWNDEEHDGVVGEVIFPNTVPPFFPSFVLFAAPPAPEDYEHRLAGIRAHNRWLVDFCDEYPERRAGVGQIFLNDLDDAIEDAKWIKEHGLRGGLLLPNVPPDVQVGQAPPRSLLRPALEGLRGPRDRGASATVAPAIPTTASTPVSQLLYITETGFYSQRPFMHTDPRGRVRALPEDEARAHRDGVRVDPGRAAQLDGVINSIRSTRSIGELRYTDEHVLKHTATEYSQRNVWVGASQPRPPDAAAREVLGPQPLHVGQRLSARRGNAPVHQGAPAPGVRRHAARGAPGDPRGERGRAVRVRPRRARVPRPTEWGPRSPRSPSRSPSCPTTRTRRCDAERARRSDSVAHDTLQPASRWRDYAPASTPVRSRAPRMPPNHASVRAAHATVMPQGNAMKPCGMSGATNSSVVVARGRVARRHA